MVRRPVTRRLLLAGTSATLLSVRQARAAGMVPTPQQTEGPFYPVSLPADMDNDLVQVRGEAAQAIGTILHLQGRVLDGEGRAHRSRSGSAMRTACTTIPASPAASGATERSRATAACWPVPTAATVFAP
jgi:hypothetical protein